MIPLLSLKDALLKSYPRIDEYSVTLFLRMCDINGDSKVEVSEVMQFFTEVFKDINSETVVEKLARIVANTDEEVAGFMEGCGVKISDSSSLMTTRESCEMIVEVFRISKYEA